MNIQELGHVVLYVSNLETSARFYRDVLGFPEIGRLPGAALFSGGRTHHELLLIEIGPVPSQESAGRRPGLYHIGLKVGTTPEELQKVAEEMKTSNISIIGATDHTVTHSIYILDPDGNELELYIDVTDAWRNNPALILSPPKPLTYLSL